MCDVDDNRKQTRIYTSFTFWVQECRTSCKISDGGVQWNARFLRHNSITVEWAYLLPGFTVTFNTSTPCIISLCHQHLQHGCIILNSLNFIHIAKKMQHIKFPSGIKYSMMYKNLYDIPFYNYQPGNWGWRSKGYSLDNQVHALVMSCYQLSIT